MRGRGWPPARALPAALLTPPPAAHAVPVTTVAMITEGIGPGSAAVYHPGNALITALHRDPQSVGVNIQQGSDQHRIIFWAPPGETLQPGTYADATAQNPTPGRPGLLVDEPHCSYGSEFEIRDLAAAPDGTVQRLWAIFELHCYYDVPLNMFGEVRINEPAPPGSLLAVPTLVRWPDQPAGSQTQDEPITVLATAPVFGIGRATLAGGDARSFSVGRDDCAGRALPAGGSCQVWVRASPRRPGPQSSAIEVGGGPEVGLQAFGRGGRTRMVLHSDPGDPLGMGRTVTLTPADTAFRSQSIYGGSWVNLQVTRPDGSAWRSFAQARIGQRLATGHYQEPPHDDTQSPRFGADASDDACRSDLEGAY